MLPRLVGLTPDWDCVLYGKAALLQFSFPTLYSQYVMALRGHHYEFLFSLVFKAMLLQLLISIYLIQL